MSAEFLFIIIPSAEMVPCRLAEARRQLTECNRDAGDRKRALAALDRYASRDLLDGECARFTPDAETAISWYVAGGSTYGEDPSEEYTALCHLNEIYDLLLGWAREDGAARIADRTTESC